MTQHHPYTVTLAALRQRRRRVGGYNRLVRALQGRPCANDDRYRSTYIRYRHDDPIPVTFIIDSNGLDDALWSLRCVTGDNVDRDLRLYAVWCARQVQHLLSDKRSLDALDVAERYAYGKATDDELAAARAAARAAAGAAAGAAADAAWAAADAAWAAADAAWAAAWAAAGAAADVARAAAWDAARDAAWDAAWDAARDAQKRMLIDVCNGVAPWQTQE